MNDRLLSRVARCCAALLLLCFVAVRIARADQPGGDGEELRWKLKAGQHFKIELDQDMKQTIDSAAGAQDVPTRFTMYMSWNVEEAKENEFKIAQVIERITMTMSAAGFGDVEFDSAKDEELEGIAAIIAGGLKPLVGLKIKQTINGRGESISCEIDPAKLEELKAASAGGGGQFANPDTLKNLIGQSACVLPEAAVEKGANWEDQFTAESQMGKMITTAKYTYEGSETLDGKSLDKIAVVSTVAVEAGEDSQAEVEITKQDNKGTVYFDNNAGYIASAVLNQSMTMNVATMGQEFTVVTVGTVTMTLTPDDGSAEKEPESDKAAEKTESESDKSGDGQ